ncbi:MAG: phage tail tape measure protein, partial [Actinomycetota bacterium]|nr:phage tail tape measure protein [Actinomycetota bacterium]
MPNVLSTAFVTVKVLSSGIGKDLASAMESGASGAGAAGGKAGKSWARGFQSSGVTKASKEITLGIAAVGVESVMAAAKFGASMTRISTQAGVPQAKLAALSRGVLAIAGKVGQGPDALAESLYHVESNFASLGITAPRALDLVKVAAEGASAGNANLEDVTNALTAAVASGIPGVSNFSQAMGVLNATVGAGDMKMQDLAEAFGTGMVAVVKGYGLSIRDVGAALDVFGDNNIRGAQAGTNLRMAVQALAVPAKAGADELKALGLNTTSFATAMEKGGLLPAIELLVTRLKKAGDSGTQMGNAITTIFGKKAGTGVAILAEQLTRLQSKYPALTKGANDFGKAWAQTAATPAQKFRELGASADALGISLGQKLLPGVMQIVDWLQKNQQTAIRAAEGIAAFAVSVTALSYAIKAVATVKTVFTAIAGGISAIAGGVSAIRGFSAASVAAAAVQKGLASSTLAVAAAEGTAAAAGTTFAVSADGVTTSLGAMTIGEKAAAVGMAALDAVNPVAWMVAAAAAIAALGVVLVKNSDQTGALISQYQQQDKATGFSISGYQKLAGQLNTVNDSQSRLSQTVRLSSGPVALAKFGSAAYSTALGEVTTAQFRAQSTARNLVTGLGELAASYGITQKQAEELATGAGVTATQFAASGTAGDLAQQKVFQYGNTAGKAAIQADQLANANGGVTTSLDGMVNQLLATQGDLTGFRQAQMEAVTALAASSTGLRGNSAAALAAQQAVNQATYAAEQFVKAEQGVPGGAAKASQVLQEQITFLRQHGDNSAYAAQEIGVLERQLAALKSPAPANIIVHGDGTFSVAGNAVKARAAGGLITGGIPGKDSVLSALMPGEVVVPAGMVRAGAVDHLRGSLPGFASGGIVPSYSGAPGQPMGNWAAGNFSAMSVILD